MTGEDGTRTRAGIHHAPLSGTARLRNTYLTALGGAATGFAVALLVRSFGTSRCVAGDPGCLTWALYAFVAAMIAAAVFMNVVGSRLGLPSVQHLLVVLVWLVLVFGWFAGVLPWWVSLPLGLFWPALVVLLLTWRQRAPATSGRGEGEA